ncbi:hypothetical protein ACOSP7_018138 [Xanthoceras sorbifolium]
MLLMMECLKGDCGLVITGGRNWRGDRDTNEGSKAAEVEGSFESDRGTNVMSKEAKEKSEERREAPVVVVGSTSIKDRVMEELILHLNNNYLLVGEKGGDTVCEPDPLREVVRALFEVEMVINSNSLCSEMNGMDRGVLRDTGQGVKGMRF